MKLDYSGIKLNIEQFGEIDPIKEYLLFLHGFTGCAEDWIPTIEQLPAKYNLFSMDIIGHGKSDSPLNVSFYTSDSITNQIKFVKDHLTTKKIFVIGYSMGGRAALSFAVTYPDEIRGLVLESSTVGIRSDEERKKRYEEDLKIAEFIETHTLDEFIEMWQDKEIFNTQRRFSNDKLKKIKKKKASGSKVGYANILKGFSTGIMPPLHDKLKNIPTKILLISGDLDTKFTGINARLAKRFYKAKHKIVKNSGHNTHLEEPKRFIEILTNYFNQIESPQPKQQKKFKAKK
jgi:2-succinyl-6-hydroxy-2,4-cyclohexadiene-1-carboxylate synthase